MPYAREARLEKAHVIKELRATFSAAPGTEALRPPAETERPDLFLAGDWTRSGWPATMEGAVRSGYLAAEGVARASGSGAIPAAGYRMISCGADDRFVSSAQPRERQTTKNDGLSHGGIGH